MDGDEIRRYIHDWYNDYNWDDGLSREAGADEVFLQFAGHASDEWGGSSWWRVSAVFNILHQVLDDIQPATIVRGMDLLYRACEREDMLAGGSYIQSDLHDLTEAIVKRWGTALEPAKCDSGFGSYLEIELVKQGLRNELTDSACAMVVGLLFGHLYDAVERWLGLLDSVLGADKSDELLVAHYRREWQLPAHGELHDRLFPMLTPEEFAAAAEHPSASSHALILECERRGAELASHMPRGRSDVVRLVRAHLQIHAGESPDDDVEELLNHWASSSYHLSGASVSASLRLLTLEERERVLMRALRSNYTYGFLEQFGLCPTAEVFDTAIRCLVQTPNYDNVTRDSFAIGVARGGSAVVEHVRERTQEVALVREGFALGVSQLDSPEATTYLLTALSDKAASVRNAAAMGLARQIRQNARLLWDQLEAQLLAASPKVATAIADALVHVEPCSELDGLLDRVVAAKPRLEAALARLGRSTEQAVRVEAVAAAEALLHADVPAPAAIFARVQHGLPITREERRATVSQLSINEWYSFRDFDGLSAPLRNLLRGDPDDPLLPYLVTLHMQTKPGSSWLYFFAACEVFEARIVPAITQRIHALEGAETLAWWLIRSFPGKVKALVKTALHASDLGLQRVAARSVHIDVHEFRAATAAFLKHRRADQRELGALALTRSRDPKLAQELRRALSKEKVAQVRDALRRAEVALSWGHPPRGLGESEILARLAKLPEHPIEGLEGFAAPELVSRSGHKLSRRQAQALLWVLALEERDDPPVDASHPVRALLHHESLAELSDALFQLYLRDKRPDALQWCVDQLAVGADARLVHEAANEELNRRNASKARHTRLALLRHGSTMGTVLATPSWQSPLFWSVKEAVPNLALAEQFWGIQQQYRLTKEQGQDEARECGRLDNYCSNVRNPWRRTMTFVTNQARDDVEPLGDEEHIGFSVSFDAVPVLPEGLGELCQVETVFVSQMSLLPDGDSYAEGRARRVVRERVAELGRQRQKDLPQLRSILSTMITNKERWTFEDARYFWLRHALGRVLGTGVVFRTNDGVLLTSDPRTRTWMQLGGEPFATPRDGWLVPVLFGDLPDEAKELVRAHRDSLKTTFDDMLAAAVDLDVVLSSRDAMSELRDLLYDEPGESTWDALVSLLSSWPQDSVADAVAYAQPHLASWPEGWRVSPDAWVASILDADSQFVHAVRDTGSTIPASSAPLLLCDTLLMQDADVRESTVGPMLETEHLVNIENLLFVGGRLYAGVELPMARKLNLPKLHTLAFERTAMRRDSLGFLAGASFWKGLRTLYIGEGRPVSRYSIAGLLESGSLDACESLYFWFDESVVVTMLLASSVAPRLRLLGLLRTWQDAQQFQGEDHVLEAVNNYIASPACESLRCFVFVDGNRDVRQVSKSSSYLHPECEFRAKTFRHPLLTRLVSGGD